MKIKEAIKILYELTADEDTSQTIIHSKDIEAIYIILKDREKLIEENENLTLEVLDITNVRKQNYISKDKIKEKIEEYKRNTQEFEEYWAKDPRKFKKEKCVDYYKLEALQELMEDK